MEKCTYPNCSDCPRNTQIDESNIDFDFKCDLCGHMQPRTDNHRCGNCGDKFNLSVIKKEKGG